ncbi:MAG: restriction endonuclease [Flavisolibacter sp.]
MMKNNPELSPSKATAVKTVYEAFKILKEEGGQLSGKEVMNKVGERVSLNEWEKDTLEKTGNIRWQSIFHFYTIDCMKAGYLKKVKGIWYITPEGEEALAKYSAIEFFESASLAYKKWRAENKKTVDLDETDAISEDTSEQSQQATLDQLEGDAIEGIKSFINLKNPYEFQDLVAALLRAMGYHTPFISPKGRDGGIDIIAFQDPLGIQTPRLKVQVKHYPQNPIAADAIRSLKGLVNSGDEVGLFVTSGRFSPEAERFAREANVHIKLIDGDELISLWQQYYPEMNDEDKYLLPLHPIYFLGSNE